MAKKVNTAVSEIVRKKNKEIKKLKSVLREVCTWLEQANDIIQDGLDAEEGDDEDCKALLEYARSYAK
jgi:vacuolar-type H+-ATPase subunit I/STV1